jgi:hypothetical protein
LHPCAARDEAPEAKLEQANRGRHTLQNDLTGSSESVSPALFALALGQISREYNSSHKQTERHCWISTDSFPSFSQLFETKQGDAGSKMINIDQTQSSIPTIVSLPSSVSINQSALKKSGFA